MRERVERTSMAVEAGVEKVRRGPGGGWGGGPQGAGVDRRRWRQHDIEANVEEEQAHGVNPAAVGEAVGEAPTWTR
jgi:hypothetical protein